MKRSQGLFSFKKVGENMIEEKQPLLPEEVINVGDLGNILIIINSATFEGKEAEYIAVLKHKLKRNIEFYTKETDTESKQETTNE